MAGLAGPEALAELSERLLGNPFVAPRAVEEADRAFERDAGDIGDAFSYLVRSGQTKLARRLAVAATYHAHLHGNESPIRRRGAFAERALNRIGLSGRAIDQLGAGAARCTRTLRRLFGESAAIGQVRAAAWKSCFGDSVYEAVRMTDIIRQQNVLVLGETGTGKEIVAQAVAVSAAGPLQEVSAAAIPNELLESELFGYVRGAFTGATGNRTGKIVAAHRGTLFLDELADLSPEIQPKLLRVIETDQVVPLGGMEMVEVDVRYVSATSRDLLEMVSAGTFRRDLYQRLAGITIEIPPLRERPEDILPIADGMFDRFKRQMEPGDDFAIPESTAHISRMTAIHARFRSWLEGDEARAHQWPGNVRELENMIRTRILGFGQEPAAHNQSGTRPVLATPETEDSARAAFERFLEGRATLREITDWYVLHVLSRCGYSQRKAARVLGIDRGTLARRIKRVEQQDDD